MIVSCLPGVARENLRDHLHGQHTKVGNLRGGVVGGNAFDWLLSYLDWAGEAARVLSPLISSADVERLVLTPRYHAMLPWAAQAFTSDAWRVLNGLISTEVEQRTAAFGAAVASLDQQIARWSIPGEIVVLDTNIYIEHPQKLEELDFTAHLPVTQENVHVLVPIAVIDELDGLKKIKDRDVRWRAGYTLAVLDRLFKDPSEQTYLRKEDDTSDVPSGVPTIELLFDPPGHVRLPITDDEIVNRILAIQPLTDRRIVLLTYDSGQAMRARAIGLRAVKLTKPIGDEPSQ